MATTTSNPLQCNFFAVTLELDTFSAVTLEQNLVILALFQSREIFSLISFRSYVGIHTHQVLMSQFHPLQKVEVVDSQIHLQFFPTDALALNNQIVGIDEGQE